MIYYALNINWTKFIIITNMDNIIKIIIQITHELFNCLDNLNNKKITLKFTKYLVQIIKNQLFILVIKFIWFMHFIKLLINQWTW